MKYVFYILAISVAFMLPSCYTNVIESEDFVPGPNNSDSVPSSGNNEEGIDYLADALPFLFETLSECENISDADKHLQQIKEFQGVEDAWTEGEELYVSIKGWETMGFTFHQENIDEEMDDESSQTKTAVKAMEPRMDAAVRPEGKTLKAVIANQQHYDERVNSYIENYYYPLQRQLKSCGIETKYEDKPGLSFFAKDIYNYDLVFLVTHGAYSEKTGIHSLLTGDEFCQVPKKKWYQFFRDERDEKADEVKAYLDSIRKVYNATKDHIWGKWVEEKRGGEICWVYRPAIREKFIQECAQGRFNNPFSIFFNTACLSVKDNASLNVQFLSRGLGVYLGYDESNSIGKKAGPAFFESLLSGFSVKKAYNSLPSQYRSQINSSGERANLKYYISPTAQKDNAIFLFPTLTKQIGEGEVNAQYKNEQTIEIEGEVTSIKPETISFGFRYGTDKNELTWEIEADKNIEKKPNSDVLFRCKLKDNLKGEQTYYYCAYTYDGSSYNCGDTLSFGLPKIEIVGCPDNNHPHAIDLGLPSGTKWACCNIGADSPEGYGGYYAWGETEEKSCYDWDAYIYGDWMDCDHIGYDIAGTQYDVAHVKWGGSWRMPSLEQLYELIGTLHIKWKMAYQNDVFGQLITGPNGSTIFLPCADYHWDDYFYDDKHGYYWSSSLYRSSLNSDYEDEAYCLCLYQDNGGRIGNISRRCGLSVRAVCP